MNQNIILFVNAIRPATFAALAEYKKISGRSFTPVVLVDTKIQKAITLRNGQLAHADKVKIISADFDSPTSVRKALRPYEGNIFAVTSQYENSILELKKLIPYLPYLPMPTEKSLEWSTEKKLMRSMLQAYDPKLVPKYKEITDSSSATVAAIEKAMSYPLIVKPSGLEGSLLVSMVSSRQELQATLEHTFRQIQKGYDTWIKRQVPAILVEEFMEGDMYSVDTYVAEDGITCRSLPPVHVVTGKKVGFEDFFGYVRIIPSGLSNSEIRGAHQAAEKACHAMGLRAITAHVELMRTDAGWKIIELGPRIGGYRHEIYQLSYGANHIVNDILNRSGELPIIPEKLLRHTAIFNIYAHEEGLLEKVTGVDKIKDLASFISLNQEVHIGEPALFAKNNGDPIFNIVLSHEDSTILESDVRYLEETLHCQVKPLTTVYVEAADD